MVVYKRQAIRLYNIYVSACMCARVHITPKDIWLLNCPRALIFIYCNYYPSNIWLLSAVVDAYTTMEVCQRIRHETSHERKGREYRGWGSSSLENLELDGRISDYRASKLCNRAIGTGPKSTVSCLRQNSELQNSTVALVGHQRGTLVSDERVQNWVIWKQSLQLNN